MGFTSGRTGDDLPLLSSSVFCAFTLSLFPAFLYIGESIYPSTTVATASMLMSPGPPIQVPWWPSRLPRSMHRTPSFLSTIEFLASTSTYAARQFVHSRLRTIRERRLCSLPAPIETKQLSLDRWAEEAAFAPYAIVLQSLVGSLEL